MHARLLTAITALALLGGLAEDVRAQQSSGTTFGSPRPTGGTLSYGGSSAFGNNSMGNMGGMNSSGSFGSPSTGSFMSNVRQPGSFVGGNAQNAQAIAQQIGGSQQGSTGTGMYGTGMNAMGMGGANSSRRNLLNQTRTGQNVGGQTQTANTANVSPLRGTLHEDFEHPVLSPSDAVASLSRRLENTSAITGRSLEVTLQDQTVVLRGEVTTEHGRLLAEQLARLEPGIWQVRNELTVRQSEVSPKHGDAQPQPLRPALKVELQPHPEE